MRGQVLGTAAVAGIVPVNEADATPLAWGPQCWLLEDPQWIIPWPADGRLGLWMWDPSADDTGKILRVAE